MAVISAILSPAATSAKKTAALATVTSSAEIVLGNNTIFAINATGDITIKFGVAGMTAAAATDFRVPANTMQVFDTGNLYSSVRVFNLAATATDIYIQPLSKF